MSASKCISRLSSRFPPLALKFNPKPTSPPQISASAKGVPQISRLPVELGCAVSMMPLHSAIASARLRSFLSVESQSWGLIPQGNSMPL